MLADPLSLLLAALALLATGFLAGWLLKALHAREELHEARAEAAASARRLAELEAAWGRKPRQEVQRLRRRVRELESLDRVLREREERSFQLDFLFRSQLEERDARIQELERRLAAAAGTDAEAGPGAGP